MELLKIALIVLLVDSSYARPQTADVERIQETSTQTTNADWKALRSTEKTTENVRGDSSSVHQNETQRHLKDLQHINQSLRTVATQLLNVTSPDEPVKETKVDKKVEKVAEKNEATFVKEINSEISNLESMGVSFGRPVNSKFGYFESSHPGQAMVMTDEELEKEMSSTRLITAYKNHPTTTGGISTWILLNPPSTTVKTITGTGSFGTPKEPEHKVRYTLKPIVTHGKIEVKNTKNEQKVTPQLPSTASIEKISPSTKKATSSITKKTTLASSTKQDETTQSLEKLEAIESTTSKVLRTTVAASTENKITSSSTSSTATTKKVQIIRSTVKPKSTTPRPTVLSKPGAAAAKRPQQNKLKPSGTRRTTVKPEISKNETFSTAKVEKVTFKPVPMITTPKTKTQETEKPMFITKIKASVLMDTQKTTPMATSPSLNVSPTSKPNFSDADLVEIPVKSKPLGASINNVLKVQLKKPVDESTQIEIEPIKVNTPILTIQKVDKKPDDEMMDIGLGNLNSSSIDLKFDFNPELTKISTEIESSSSTASTSTTPSTTTKRHRNSNKRKKNKVRRRKPSSTTPLLSTTSTTTTTTAMSTTAPEKIEEISTEPIILDNAIQESKIEPESKITNNNTKTKKKPPQKGISSQIYSFLSREVMPSFGVMSLLGLGLGLASYFLYPFGGTITRRNYEVEPNYKYNLDEYGGNYGQSEEEVLSKVLQGMTNHENKFTSGSTGVKDLDNNYYRYQHFDGAYDGQSIRRTDQRYPLSSSSPVYKPTENTVLKYRNTDYRYSEAQTTPTYYDPQKHSDFVVGQDVPGNRQFVVGNVPKEYPPFTDKRSTLSTSNKKGPNVFQESTESGLTQFERDIAQGLNFPPNTVNRHGYQPETQTLRPEESYEEIEITPTAVAVEHGPRSLKVKRSIPDLINVHRSSRSKRDSVIQVIPSKHELEEEQKEENISNEILDIIDSALPGAENTKVKDNEVEDFVSHKKKLHEESHKRRKEAGLKNTVPATSVENDTDSTKQVSEDTVEAVEKLTTEKEAEKTDEDTPLTSTSSSDKDLNNTEQTKDDETTVEWMEETTTKKPAEEGFNIFSFVKKVAEIKFRLGLTILKHASEGFARYLGHVQKRINGEE